MADGYTPDPAEPTIGEVYDFVLEHGPVVLYGWRFTVEPELTAPTKFVAAVEALARVPSIARTEHREDTP